MLPFTIMTERFIKTTACFSLLIHLLTFIFGGVAVVCYGEDGHVATEITLAESCCAQPFESSPLPVFQTPTTKSRLIPADSCGPCVDIPVSMIIAHHRFNSDQDSSFQTLDLPLVFQANSPTQIADFTLKSRISPIPVANDAATLSLQTIVLLI